MDVYLKNSNLAFLLKNGTYLDCSLMISIFISPPPLCPSCTYGNTMSIVHVPHMQLPTETVHICVVTLFANTFLHLYLQGNIY